MTESNTTRDVVRGRKGKRKSVALKNFNRIIFAVSAFSIGAYLFCVNSFSVRGFELNSLRQKADALKKENLELELSAAELESYQNLDGKFEKIGMVKADGVEYLDVLRGVVAKK